MISVGEIDNKNEFNKEIELKSKEKIINEGDYKVYANKYGIIISNDEMNRVKIGNWLNSNNIRFFVNYIKEKHEQNYWNNEKSFEEMLDFKRIYYYNDDFLSKLTLNTLSTDENTWNYKNICFVTSKFHKNGFLIFDFFDRLLFVVNKSNSHWFLVEINCEKFDRFRFIIYDSMNSQITNKHLCSLPIMKLLKKYCEAEINKRCCCDYKNDHECEYLKRLENVEYLIENVPQQSNGFDCGVFVCGFLEDITLQREIKFTQDKTKEMRKRLENLYQQ